LRGKFSAKHLPIIARFAVSAIEEAASESHKGLDHHKRSFPMALTNAYVLPTNRIADVFSKIRDGQAPSQFTNQLLKDWGFSSSNDRAFIPLLKALGFLSPTGQPTQRYHDYRDHSRSKAVMAEALRDAYGDIFLITANPKPSDKGAIEGKFKSFHNVSDNVAQLMTKTFYGLLNLADLNAPLSPPIAHLTIDEPPGEAAPTEEPSRSITATGRLTGFHYNIQVHLPATKDVEIYNAIFKSLKEHFVE
jgi:hypothetical protein